jgi:hypothetical protein
MGRSTEPEQPDAVARLDTRHTKAAKANDAGAQERGSVQIVQFIGKRKSEIGANDCIFSIAAVYRVTGKRGCVTEILQTEVTIAARAVRSAHPGHAHACADRKFVHVAGRRSAYDFADNLMSGDYSGARGW